MEELKINDCPFCNNKSDFSIADKLDGIYQIECLEECGLTLERKCYEGEYIESEQELIRRWNSLRQMS